MTTPTVTPSIHTFFRNYGSGYRARFKSIGGVVVDDINNLPGGNGPLRGAGAMAYSYWMSWLGNVLGTSGHTNGWLYNTSGGTPGIWMLGWDSGSPFPTDANVANTAIRDGNFDYLTNSVTWASTNTAHTLPNSHYLTRKPAFFNAGSGYTWPWVNPTGSPQLYTLPAKARYDAGRRSRSLDRWCRPDLKADRAQLGGAAVIHASRLVSTRGGWQKPEAVGSSDQVWRQLCGQLRQALPQPTCHVQDPRLELVEGFWRDAPLAFVEGSSPSGRLSIGGDWGVVHSSPPRTSELAAQLLTASR